MPQPDPSFLSPHDGGVLLLRALAWVCAEPTRAERLLALTGLDPSTLRSHADAPDMLNAVGAYLAAHEPDLVACAGALGISPSALAGARA
jgi:hypothetical protein